MDKLNPCYRCIERRIGCHGHCKNYIDYSKANKKDKPKGVFLEYAKDRATKRLRRERGSRK